MSLCSGRCATHGSFSGRAGTGDAEQLPFRKPFYVSGLQHCHLIVFTDILDNSRVISEEGKKKVGAVL